MDATGSVLRFAKSFLAGTLLSRISGLLRDIAMAAAFGSSAEIAAFMTSYRLSNLFRRLLGEGNLQAGFVPHFSALQEEGKFFFRDTFYSLAILLLGAVLFLEGGLWLIYFYVPSDWREIIELAMWMVPGLFFICLSGLNTALLQCRKKFFLPAVAPVFFNMVWIFSVLFFKNVYFLAAMMSFAFGAQWVVTLGEGKRLLSKKEWLCPKIFSSEFKKILKPLFLGMMGVGALQFNSALDAIFARMADLKGPAFLWYAARLEQLPLALFGLSLSGALLPSLSQEKSSSERQILLETTLKYSSGLMLVCMFGMFALGRAGINLLYGHGDFSVSDVRQTCFCLWGYAIGLLPSMGVLILSQRFYAEKEYKIPALASFFSVLFSISLNSLFIFYFGWGAISIAIATSLSAFLNAILLSFWTFRLKLSSSFWIFFLKVGAVCILSWALVLGIEKGFIEEEARGFLQQTSQFLILSLTYLGSFFFFCSLFRLQEFFQMLGLHSKSQQTEIT